MRTIEIDNLILVEVPKDASDFRIVNKESLRTALLFSVGITAIPYKLPNGEYEIIGLIETPNLTNNGEFEIQEDWIDYFIEHGITYYKNYLTDKFVMDFNDYQSFRTRIQRKIQDAGIELTGNLLLIKKLK